MRRVGLLVPLLALTAGTAPLAAQDTLPLAPGARLRVVGAGDRAPRVGTLVRLGADSLVLRPEVGRPAQAYALPALASVEVSRGRRANPAATALGLAVGGAGGAALGAGRTHGLGVIGGLFLGGFAGALAGGEVAGRLWRREQWRHVRVVLAPAP